MSERNPDRQQFNLGRSASAAKKLAQNIIERSKQTRESIPITTNINDFKRLLVRHLKGLSDYDSPYVIPEITDDYDKVTKWIESQANPESGKWTESRLPAMIKAQNDRISHGQFRTARVVMEYQEEQARSKKPEEAA